MLSRDLRIIGQDEGPEFEEFCIDEGRYLSSRRDRSPCLPCALHDLCQAGFEEQERRVALGLNPSLTDGTEFPEEALDSESLLKGLSKAQVSFLIEKIPSLTREGEGHGR